MNALMEMAKPSVRETVQTMSSREIAELTGKHHNNICRDIGNMLETLGELKISFESEYPVATGNGGVRSARQYLLPKRETLILVSGYSIPLRARIIDRWQELEAQAALPAATVFPDLADPTALRGLLLGYTERVIELTATVAEQQPKADFYDAYADSTGRILFRAFAKQLNCSERELRSFLVPKYMYHAGGWLPRAQYKARGFFEVKAYTSGTGHSGVRTWFTPKGIAYLSVEFRAWQNPLSKQSNKRLPDQRNALH